MLAFAHFHWDPATGQWWHGEEPLRLSPKAGAVLHYLVTHAGQLVSTAAIRQTVWGDEGGSAAALKVCIGEIRKALQDDARRPHFIETQPRHGYRFIAPLRSPVPAETNHLSRSSAQPLLPTARLSSSALVGRERELNQLHQAFARVLHSERQFAFVSGEPGIGKTTLVNAWLSQLATQTEAILIARGQCVEQYGAGEAYLPLLEALGRLGRASDGQEVVAVLAQYAPTWLAQLPALVMPAEREALQQRLVGATQERMLREIAEGLEVLTTKRPVVLVLEDLHWSDQSTLELLSYLLRRQDSARLLLLGTFRSTEVLGNDQSLRRVVQDVHGRGPSEEIRLGLLDEEQVHDYLRTRLGRAEAAELSFHELGRWVYRRTEGNPLFMVALVEELQREEVLIETEGAWQIGEAWDQRVNQVPESLRQVIERQFESLSATDQQVLAVASVVGTEFAVSAVAAGSGQAIDRVEEQCGELAAEGHFIQEVGVEEWPDGTLGGRYSFLHALYQNVLCGRVPEVRQVQVHRRVAERKVAAYGEQAGEIAAELAMHFEAGQDYQKAFPYREQAGRNALRSSANGEAIAHFIAARDLLKKLPNDQQRIERELSLHVSLGVPLMATRGYAHPEVEKVYLRARELCQQVDSSPHLFPVLHGLWLLSLTRADYQDAHALAGQLLSLAQQANDSGLLLIAHLTMTESLCFSGEFSSSHQHVTQALTLYDPQQHPTLTSLYYGIDLRLYGLCFLALNQWHLGYPLQAFATLDEALVLGRASGHPFSLALVLLIGASVHRIYGNAETTQRLAEELITLSQEQDFSLRLAMGHILLGSAQVDQGQVAAGLSQLRKGLADYASIGTKQMQAHFLGLLAQAWMQAGQQEEALSSVTEGLTVATIRGEGIWIAELYRLKGEILLHAEFRTQKAERQKNTIEMPSVQHFAEAQGCFQQALHIARQQKAKSLELRAAMSLGRLWQNQGKTAEARALLGEVYEWFTEGFDTKDLQEAEALLISLGGRVKRQSRPAPSSPAPVEPSQSIPLSESQTTTASPLQPSAPHLFRQEGEYWTLAFAGRVCQVKHTRGMQYLAQLLRAPHHEFFAAALASGNTADSEPAFSGVSQGQLATDLSVQADLSDAGEVLDAQAQAAYKHRVAELREELAEAQAFNDAGRAEKLQAELEFLTQELTQAVGLGGRSRKAASSTERARVNVTRAIRAAITRIAANHPSLGQYLAQTIKTGTACSYTPDSSQSVTWQF